MNLSKSAYYIGKMKAHRDHAHSALLLLRAIAFLLWAASPLWPGSRRANHDEVLAGWPATSPDESFAESYVEPPHQLCRHPTPGFPNVSPTHSPFAVATATSESAQP